MISIFVLSLLVVYAMMYNNCRYKYTMADEHYILNCQTVTVVNLPPPKGIQIVTTFYKVPELSIEFSDGNSTSISASLYYLWHLYRPIYKNNGYEKVTDEENRNHNFEASVFYLFLFPSNQVLLNFLPF